MAPFPKSIVISIVMKVTDTSINPRYLINQAIQDRDGLNPIIFINSCETKEAVRLYRANPKFVSSNRMYYHRLSNRNIIITTSDLGV